MSFHSTHCLGILGSYEQYHLILLQVISQEDIQLPLRFAVNWFPDP